VADDSHSGSHTRGRGVTVTSHPSKLVLRVRVSSSAPFRLLKFTFNVESLLLLGGNRYEFY
jgi:hypothetical protein